MKSLEEIVAQYGHKMSKENNMKYISNRIYVIMENNMKYISNRIYVIMVGTQRNKKTPNLVHTLVPKIKEIRHIMKGQRMPFCLSFCHT
jgi:hypothetical protein